MRSVATEEAAEAAAFADSASAKAREDTIDSLTAQYESAELQREEVDGGGEGQDKGNGRKDRASFTVN